MGVASPHAYRRRRRLKPIAHKGLPLTVSLWNRDRGNNFPKEKALLFMVRQKANKLFWGLFLCCSFFFFSASLPLFSFSALSSFAVFGFVVASSVSLVRRFCLLGAVGWLVGRRCVAFRSVGVALLFLRCLPSVLLGGFVPSVLPLSLAVRASSFGCGCGFALPPEPGAN